MKEHLEDLKNTVINTIRKGKSQIKVTNDFDLLRHILNTWNKKQLSTGTTVNKQRPSRPCKIMSRTKNVIHKLLKADLKKITIDINRELHEHHNAHASNSAIKLILRESNLHG